CWRYGKKFEENNVKESGNKGVAMKCNMGYKLIEYADRDNGLVILDEFFKNGGSKELESSNNSARFRSNPPLLSPGRFEESGIREGKKTCEMIFDKPNKDSNCLVVLDMPKTIDDIKQ
ncbi:hypothetical protein Tco_0780680, partial [Tanacetum coccineum]